MSGEEKKAIYRALFLVKFPVFFGFGIADSLLPGALNPIAGVSGLSVDRLRQEGWV